MGVSTTSTLKSVSARSPADADSGGKPINQRSNLDCVNRRYLMRFSAERACAVSDSPRASTEAVRPSTEAPSAEQ